MTRTWLPGLLVLAAATAALADAPAVLVRDGRSFVQLRYVAESLGAQVTYDKVALSITITRGSEVVWLKSKSKHAKAKGRPIVLDQPSFVYLNITYVPLRFVATSLGAEVSWLASTREVMIIDASRGKTLKLHTNNGRGPADGHGHHPTPMKQRGKQAK